MGSMSAGPSTKRLKRTIDSPGNFLNKTNDSEGSDVWHSTAIHTSRSQQGNFPDGMSEIVGSQRSATSGDSFMVRPATPPRKPVPRSRSPVVITESSGHVKFSGVLQKHGFFLSPEGNQTQNDAMVFRKLLTDWIEMTSKSQGREREEMDNFVADMKRYLGVQENLLNSMSPTEYTKEVFQPSLLHSLLGILPLQKHLLSVLFPTLAEASYTVQDEEDVAHFSLLLNQFKWLPYLNDAEKITDDFLEIFERATPKAQHEMLRLLPDIIPETLHHKIGTVLQKLLEEFSPLCSAIMDCFSVINVPDTEIAKVRDVAVENMQVAEQKDLPAYIGFLLGVEDPILLSNIINDTREKLVFTPPVGPLEESKASLKAMVDKIRFCVSINSHLVYTWVKQIREDHVTVPSEFKTLDLFMLLLFLGDKGAENALKILVCNEDLTLRVLEDIFVSLPGVIDLVFEDLLRFCEKIFWGAGAKFYSVASKALTKCFSVVNDLNARKIIQLFTCSLVHVNKLCREQIIEALTVISEKENVRLLRFTNLIMAILDFVLEFEPDEIRSIVRILATVAYIPSNRDSERFENEFSILLRKQLSQRNEKIKSIGVVGAVATIDQLAKQEGLEVVKFQELVDLVWAIVERDGNSCWIFFDEMSVVVAERDLPAAIIDSMREKLGEKFRERWTVEESSVQGITSSDQNFKICQVMNANEAMEVEPLSIRFDTMAVGLNPFVLAAHVKFLCSLESKISDGDLQEVDIILGCPILLPEFDYYIQTDTWSTVSTEKKNLLAHYVVYAINFLRELVSAFCTVTDPLSKVKVFVRLKHLVELQKMLISFISKWENPFPSIPFAYALEKNPNSLQVFQTSKKRKAREKKTGKKVAPTPVFDDSSESDGDNGKNNKPTTQAKKTMGKGRSDSGVKNHYFEELQPVTLRPFLRRFNSNVFRLLKHKLIMTPTDVDHGTVLGSLLNDETSMRSEVKQITALNPETLILILSDLNQQVEIEKNKLYKVEDMTFVLSNKLKYFCEHLDTVSVSCEAEYATWTITKKRQVESCFLLLFTSIKNYLDRISTSEDEKFQLALKIFSEHAERIDPDSTEDYLVAQYLGGNADFINSSLTATEQLKVMKMVYDRVEMKENLGTKIQNLCVVYLKRQWKIPSALIPGMLKIWFTSSENPLAVILSLVQELIPVDSGRLVPNSLVYRSCTSTNFHTWYRVLLEALCQHVTKNLKKIEDVDATFSEWNTAVEILRLLVGVIVQRRQATIIMPLLKYSKIFLDAFTAYGIKLLPLLWGTDSNQARSFLKHLQGPTRKIQSVCEHCKVQKNTTLIRYVPSVKRSLETLIFRVREIHAVHGAPNAFWLGALKHKNLDGEEIDSQITGITDDEVEENDTDDENKSTTTNDDNLFELSDEGSDNEN